jgi:outer membrane protein assembly factor BamA
MGQMFYKLNAKDTISPSSSTMLVGIYTTSKSYFTAAVQTFYFNEDKWRSNVIAGYGNMFFQFNTAGQAITNIEDVWIDYNTNIKYLYANIQRRVFPGFFAGVEGTINSAETEYDIEIQGKKPNTSSKMNSLGYNFLYDNRNNINYTTKGFFVNYKNSFIREAFGATHEYDLFEIAANYFWDINKNSKSILVSRFYSIIASGDVPFEGQNFVGRDDLRGYSKGEFRGNQVYTAQLELRQNIYKKFGMVGFLGAGYAVPELSDLKDAEIAPSIGLGLRYLMLPSEKINIGVDVGLGKDDWSLSFRIGETFGR